MSKLLERYPWLRWVLVLFREQILVYYFGAGNFADTFNVGLRIPETSAVLISQRKGQKLAWGSGVAIIGILLAPLWIKLVAPTYELIPLKFKYTVQLAQILFLTVPILAEGALTSAFFYGVSAVSALILAGVLLPSHPEWGMKPILGIALGWVIGAVAYGSKGVRLLLGAENRPKVAGHLLDGWSFPVLLALSIFFGASQGPGAASWLSYATRLMEIGGGVALMLSSGLALPVLAAVGFLSNYWVRLFFEYGRFYPEDAAQTALSLSFYALAFLGVLSLRKLIRALPEQARAEKFIGTSDLATVGAFTLFGWIFAHRVPSWGLALGVAALIWVQWGALHLRFRVQRPGREALIWIGSVLLVGLVCLGSGHFLDWILAESSWKIGLGGGFFAGATIPLFRGVKLFLLLGEGWILLRFLKNKLTPRPALS